MKLYSPTISGSLIASSSQQLIGTTFQTGSFIASGSQQFIGTTNQTGSLIVSGSQQLIGIINVTGSLIASSSQQLIGTTNVTGSLIASGSQQFIGIHIITGSFIASGSQQLIGINNVTGSLIASGSQQFIGTTIQTGSFIASGSQQLIGTTNVTGSLIASGSQQFIGIHIITGSLIASASISSSNQLIGVTKITGSLIVSGTENLTLGTRPLATAHFQSGLEVIGFQSPANQYPTASITFSGSLYIIANTASYHMISGGIILAGNLVPAITGNMFTSPGKITSSYTLGTPTAVWKSIYVQNKSIHIIDPDSGNEINKLTAKDPIPKDPTDLTKGYWYPVNAIGSQTVEGDFNVYRVPETFTNPNSPYPPVRKGTRTGFAYQSVFNSTQIGDADSAYKSGLGLTVNNYKQSLIQSLNTYPGLDANGNNHPSGGFVTRPDLYYGGALSYMSGSGLFETDITFPWKDVYPTSSVTSSVGIPTASLISVTSGSEIIVIAGNDTEDRPEFANNPYFVFQPTSSLSNLAYYKTGSNPLFVRSAITFYFVTSSNPVTTLQNLAQAINIAHTASVNLSGTAGGQNAKSWLAVTASYVSLYNSTPAGYFPASGTVSPYYIGPALLLQSTKSGSGTNNYFAWAPSFTDSVPIFFSGGKTYVPGLVTPGNILYNDSQDTGLYKYGMGIRVVTDSDSGLYPSPYVELGDFNYINNRTRIELNDRNKYINVSASFISIGSADQSDSSIYIGRTNNSTVNIGVGDNISTAINIGTGDDSLYKVKRITIGDPNNAGNNIFYGTATAANNGGVTQIVAGTNIAISPTNGKGAVTITSIAGGSGGTGSFGANVSSSFVSSSLWTFTHGLGNKGVIVQTYDINWNQILPQILTLVDNNTVTITFPASQSGYAIASLGGNILTGSFAITGSNRFIGSQTITGSLNVSQNLTVLGTASFQYLTTIYETASVIYSSGSNQFGDAANDTQTLYGTVVVPIGSLNVTGSIISTQGFTGSLQGTSSWATNSITSYTPISTTGSTIYSTNPTTGNVSANNSIFLGGNSGGGATSANFSVFLGYYAGQLATSANESIIIGPLAGLESTRANNSIFLGSGAGYKAASASYSIVMGSYAGSAGDISSSFVSVGTNNIILGNYISLPSKSRDSINIGGIIFATGSYSTFGTVSSGSQYGIGKVGINKVTPDYTLDVSGSGNFSYNLTATGSINISGSTTQIGSNNLLGNTTLSGSIIISGSTTTPTTPTIKIYGDAETNGVVKFMPVSKNIDTTISASYIYVSGSTNDLYFSQNSNGYNNVTRLRWLEGNLYTGLLNGGIITTQSSTVYQIGSGSGIIVNLNATPQQSPYPTVQFLQWNNLSSSIESLSASFDQSFISIDSTNNIYAQGVPYTDGDINTKIPIGIVVHQNHSTINAVQTFPSVAYGWKQRTNDFIKAFGPLKISGYTLSPSGSSTGSLVLSGGTAWVDGRNYTIDRNNPSYIVEANGLTTSKIYRYYQSGSGWVYDTNNGSGYTTIDPSKYSNNGVLTSVATNDWSIQRVYYFPNSATRAFYIYYGNATYNNKDAAIAGIATETFNEAPNTAANAIFIGYMILRYNADFTVAASYQFNAAGLFRGSGQGGTGGGGGGTTTPGGSTTQIQYNNAGAFGGVSTLTYDGTTLKATGSFTGSFTGQLIGSSSYSTSSSFAQTSSFVTLAQTASYVINSQTASYVSNAISSSFATTASYALNGGVTQITAGSNITINQSTGNVTISSTGGSGGAGSNVSQSFTNQSTWTFAHGLGTQGVIIQTYDSGWNQIVPQNISASSATTAVITFSTNRSGYAIASLGGSTTTAQTASYVLNAVSASYAATASFVKNAQTSSYVTALNQNTQITGSVTISGSITLTSGSITMLQRPAFSVYGSGTTNNLSTTTNTDGTLNSNNYAANFYQGSGFNSASGIFTAPIAGLYQVDVVGRNSGYASGISQLAVLRNNSNASGDVLMIEWAASSTMNHAGGSKIFNLAINDTLRLKVLAGQINFDGNDNWSVAYIG